MQLVKVSRKIKAGKRIQLFVLTIVLFATNVVADEESDAIAATQKILQLLSGADYTEIWESHTGELYKSVVSKDSFMANMSIGRSPLGAMDSSVIVDAAYSEIEPQTGQTGKFYAVTFKNHYMVGDVYERIIVMLESDGVFRMIGHWGSPAPR